jgi:hypothetical protein
MVEMFWGSFLGPADHNPRRAEPISVTGHVICPVEKMRRFRMGIAALAAYPYMHGDTNMDRLVAHAGLRRDHICATKRG